MTEALSTRLRALAEPGQIPMKPETRALLLAAAEVAEIEAFGLPPEDEKRHTDAILERLEAELVH